MSHRLNLRTPGYEKYDIYFNGEKLVGRVVDAKASVGKFRGCVVVEIRGANGKLLYQADGRPAYKVLWGRVEFRIRAQATGNRTLFVVGPES